MLPDARRHVRRNGRASYTTGRFSGGSNYIDTLGQILDAPIENFAIGGARTGISNQSNPFSWGFTYEVDQFLGVGAQSGVFPTIDSFDEGDLVTVSIGGNDGRAYQIGGGTEPGAAAAAEIAVTAASANLDRLVAAGAPTISFLAGNTGLLPEVDYYPDPAMAAAVRTAFSDSYAAGMQATLAGYAADGVMVHYLDLGEVLENVSADLDAFGLSAVACPAFPAPVGPGSWYRPAWVSASARVLSITTITTFGRAARPLADGRGCGTGTSARSPPKPSSSIPLPGTSSASGWRAGSRGWGSRCRPATP